MVRRAVPVIDLYLDHPALAVGAIRTVVHDVREGTS